MGQHCFSSSFEQVTTLDFYASVITFHNESCREKIAPISPKCPKFVAQTDFVYN